jgi:acetyl esterase/lipase
MIRSKNRLTFRAGIAGLALAALLSLPQARAAEPAMPPPARRDVVYCAPGGVPLKLDLYAPAKPASGPLPAVLFVHGGSWSGGDKAGSEGVLETADLLERGYLVAAINYRLFPEYTFPAPIHDVKCAVRYLRANAAALGIDPQRIGAWGTSAGGMLVSLLGTTDRGAGLEGDGGYADQSSRVQAVADLFGRADLAPVPQTRPDLLPVFGGPDNLALYSPVTYVSADDPPFLIVHGDDDTVVPPELSQEFFERLRSAGVPAELLRVAHAGHGLGSTTAPTVPARAEITPRIGDFFARTLRSGYRAVRPTPAPPAPGSLPAALPTGGDQYACTQTGQVVRSLFLRYWRAHGSVAQQGYPISGEVQEVDPADGKPYTMQYFERAVFEYHPENQAPYDVLPALLGNRRYWTLYPDGAPGQQPNTTPGSALFTQTNHRVGGAFLAYWRSHGGVPQQGYPISDEFTEISALDGKPYTVQYFERAVFEWHPENDAANQVLLAQLGTFAYRAEHGGR